MLKIRLQRVGKIHEPAFRLVLTDLKNSTKSGRFLEILGNYDARKGEKAAFKTDRITYWMSKGAQVSDTVHNLLVSMKVIEGKKINKLPLKKAIVKEQQKDEPVVTQTAAPAEAPVAEAPIAEETPAVETPAEEPVAEAVV